MKRCLVAGFGFFAYRGRFYDANPAGEAAEALDGASIGDCKVVGLVVPVSRDGLKLVEEELEDTDVAVGLGLYTPGTPHIRVEVIAVNALMVDDRVERVVEDDPLWAEARVPVDPVRVARAASVAWSARPSLSTGLYYCNALAYILYRWSRVSERPSVFLHLPWSTRLAERLDPLHPHPAPLASLIEAVERVVRLLAGG